MSRRHTCAVFRRVAVIAGAALLLAGCGLGEARDTAARLAQVKPFGASDTWLPGLAGISGYAGQGLGPIGYPNVSDSGSLNPTQAFLATLLLQNSDLTGGATIGLIPRGDTLAAPTLDFCGGSYPSESLRLARRQVAAYNADGNYAGVSTEAVQYETSDAALQALAELVAQKRRCPDGTTYVDSDGVSHTVTFFPAPAPEGTKVTDDHAVLHLVDKSEAGDLHMLLVWQVRGNVLQAIYASGVGAEPFDQTTLDGIFGLVTSLTNRLQAADGVDLGQI